MPIILAIIAIIVVGLGAYFFTNQSGPAAINATELVVTEELLDVDDTDAIAAADEDDTEPAVDAEVVSTTESIATTPEPTPDPAVTAVERSVDVSYLTPARTSHDMTVSLTVADGIVTAANIVYDNGTGFSNDHQRRFDGAFRAEVVGQPIDSIRLSRVGGASLTSGAFNEAVAQIATQL